MYAIWTKLTAIEDVLIGSADEVVDYLRTNYFTPVQQIRCMLSERAAQLKRNSLQESTTNSCSFCLLSESDSPFDSLCDYVGFILYSYDGKSRFTFNGREYQRGDILIKNTDKIPNWSSILRSRLRNQKVYNDLYKSLLNSTFKKASYERFVGLGITYEQNKWKFDAFIIGSEAKGSVFSLDEQRLLEMYILSWTKNMNDQLSIRDDARKMLDEQLDYVKCLLETQRFDMEKIWTLKDVDIAIKTFEHESQDEIDALFQTTPAFNTFSNLRDKIQSKQENRLSVIADIFDHRQLTLKTQPSEPSLYQVWKHLKMVENWLREKEFNSLVNFLNLNTFVSIESLFSIPVPLFLNQLGICPESDQFNPTLNYIGFLIYLYNDQDEFTVDKHRYKRGQLLIVQKEKFSQVVQVPNYRQTSFAPLFIHEYLYDWYFKEKSIERFQGIGFVYEQNKWKFDVITYAGKHGIYSTYDIRGDNPMAPSRDEQHSMDLILSTIYIHNKWKEESGRMYTIEDLQSIGRELVRKEIGIIEKLFQVEKTNETSLDKTFQLAFKNFIDQYRPKPTVKPRGSTLKRTISQDIREKSNHSDNIRTLNRINSKLNDDSKQSTSTVHRSDNNLPTNPERTQSARSSTSRNPGLPDKTIKPRNTQKPPISIGGRVIRSLARSTSQDSSSTTGKRLDQRNSVPTKEKEPITFYQVWRELKDAEQKLLCNPDLTQFINYLTKREYLNYSESVRFTPPDNQVEEYNLVAKIKIESEMQFLNELFLLKKSKFFQQQSSHVKQHLDDLFDEFEEYYVSQNKKAKDPSKLK